MEWVVIALFCLGLLGSVLAQVSLLYALAAGLFLFLFYGKIKKFSWKALVQMVLDGIKSVRNILVTFVLIGILTALWRGAGTIPVLVTTLSQLIHPSLFLMLVFLFNCMISILTGTAFGTAATMGVICATIGHSMGLPMVMVGGAVLSGVYFGDRCSPVSTSALLVAQLTGTELYHNIRGMLKTASFPFLLSLIGYGLLGFRFGGTGEIPQLQTIFEQEFVLHWCSIFPALVILVLALGHVNVKYAMGLSILSALPICVFVQQIPLSQIPALMVFGFQAQKEQVAAMLNGGGILSMLNVAAIVCLSSAYSGIFQKTGLLTSIQDKIIQLASHTNPFFATLCTAIATGMVACNQTLTILLTHQLCEGLESKERQAITLENTAVVVAPLIPWSIAGAVPLASVGAPTESILFAWFLYLLPIWQLIRINLLQNRKP